MEEEFKRARLMIRITLQTGHLTIMVHADRETDHRTLGDATMSPLLIKGMGVVMPLWMQ